MQLLQSRPDGAHLPGRRAGSSIFLRESFDADDEAYEESAASYVICVTFCAFGVPLRAKGLGVTPER
jgi:hypothetical protein